MAINVLQLDEHGNVVAKPVIGWMITTDKDVTVLAAIEYADSPSELTTESSKIQLDLTPQQSLQLADALTKVANHVLEESSKDHFRRKRMTRSRAGGGGGDRGLSNSR
jgi:hypothetical protein